MATHKQTELVRHQIIRATDELLYQKGYNAMSFSDIAEASGVPRGNLNYHFKTKKEVLEAVIDFRIEQMKTMLEEWDAQLHTPLERLKRFAQIPVIEKKTVTKYGCPMGSLNTELGKKQEDLQMISRQQFDLFREWLSRQFRLLAPFKNSDELAVHLLVQTQGLVVLAHTYDDTQVIDIEVAHILSWLETIKN